MKTSFKILSILLIFLFIIANISFATDINMNLQEDTTLEYENTVEDENTVTNEMDATTIDNQEDDIQSTSMPSTSISSVSSVPDETLGLTNILNILLIVVGVVLILLGIAILIRMHS